MKKKLMAMSHHRNGISGEPFYTGLFRDNDGSVKVFVDFGKARFAVLQIDKLSGGDVAFGSNSWRGDHYADEIRVLCKKASPKVSAGSLYVDYGVPGNRA